MRGCRLLCLFLSLPLVYACVVEEVSCLDRYVDNPFPTFFVAGLLGMMVVYGLFLHHVQLFSFIEVFVHELAHMLMHYLTLSQVVVFVARVQTDSGGITREGKVVPTRSNFLTTLAPYYFPTFMIPFLVARAFMHGSGARIMSLFVGVTLGFHYVLFVSDFYTSQHAQPQLAHDAPESIPDTKKVGGLFSALFCLIAGALILMFVLNIVWGAEKQVLWYHFVNIWPRALRYYKEVVVYFCSLVRTLI
jgi:hypothetical protein